MLSKLLKYDLKDKLKFLIIFYILSIFFACLTRILFEVNQTVIINIIGKISLGTTFSMLCSTLINNFMRFWIRFEQTLYKDEGYLLHTLPVSKISLFESKFISTVVGLLSSFIVLILSLFIVFYSKENLFIVKNLLNKLSNYVNVNSLFMFVSIIIILFLELLNLIESGYLGIILGNKVNNGKIIKSILYGFLVYIVSQIIVLLFVLLLGLFNNDIMSIFTSTKIDLSIIKFLIYYLIFIYLFNIVLINIVCVYFLNKGVNLD